MYNVIAEDALETPSNDCSAVNARQASLVIRRHLGQPDSSSVHDMVGGESVWHLKSTPESVQEPS